jgi:hypothetical protein
MQRLAGQTGETVCRLSPTGESMRNLLRRDSTALDKRALHKQAKQVYVKNGAFELNAGDMRYFKMKIFHRILKKITR